MSDCNEGLNTRYKKYSQLDSGDKVVTTYNFKEIKTKISSSVKIAKLSTRDTNILEQIIFSSFYLTSGNEQGFMAINNNFASIDLTTDWANSSNFFNKNSYVCLTNDADIVIPYAVFDTLSQSISFLTSNWFLKMNQLSLNNKVLKAEEVLKFWVININVSKDIGLENYNKISVDEKKVMETKINLAINLFKTTKI